MMFPIMGSSAIANYHCVNRFGMILRCQANNDVDEPSIVKGNGFGI
jgi:hypothetical protein